MMKYQGMEKRKTQRRKILDSFSLFLSVPKKGPHRLPVHDVSEGGIAFHLDTEGEEISSFAAKSGDILNVQFYLNQSLSIALPVKIVHIETEHGLRKIGAEFSEHNHKGYQALCSFLKMLDEITDAAEVGHP